MQLRWVPVTGASFVACTVFLVASITHLWQCIGRRFALSVGAGTEFASTSTSSTAEAATLRRHATSCRSMMLVRSYPIVVAPLEGAAL